VTLDALKPVLRFGVGHVGLVAALGLTALGLASIRTAGFEAEYQKQLIFVPIALVAMCTTALIHYRRLADLAGPMAIVTLLMLVVVLFTPARNGAHRWFNLGLLSFQPSELAKIVFILALAKYLRYRENYRTFLGLFVPLAITFVPMSLILIEPNLGTAMLLLPVLFAMLVTAGAKLKHIILIVALGVGAMPAMYPLLEPHQKARIDDVVARMTGDTRHARTISFQGQTATRLVGSGGLVGHPATHAGHLVEYNGLPEAHNDMVFAVVCTRWGLVGGTAVLGLYLLLIISGLVVAALSKDPFARLVAVGVVTVIATQVTVNVGMTIGLLPITGIALPLLSYGGSSLLMNFAMVGLLLNVAARRPLIMARPSFEFDAAPAHPR
jgi:rod shape determining protein RodA